MSIYAQKWAFEQAAEPSGAKFVLIILAWFADQRGVCFPSQDTITHMTGMSNRSVRTHLITLESAGLIERLPEKRKAGRTCITMYRILAPTDRLRASRSKTDQYESLSSQDTSEFNGRHVLSSSKVASDTSGNFCQNHRQILQQPPANSAAPLTTPNKVELLEEPLGEPLVGARDRASNHNHDPCERQTAGKANPSARPKQHRQERGCRLPADWEPTETDRSTIAAECPNLDLDRATREFHDYWAGIPGQRGVKLDWSATWRNAMRFNWDKGKFLKLRVSSDTNASLPNRPMSAADQRAAEVRRLLQESREAMP